VEIRSDQSIDLHDPTASSIATVADMLNHGGQLTVGIALGDAGSYEDDEDNDSASFYTVPSVSELHLDEGVKSAW
jgi:hypothetical protein